MSILIKGMEMPKNCFDCPLFDDVYTDADGDDDYICGLGVPLDYYQASGKTKKDCPLVHVPPHGRLIDADALTAKFKEMGLGEHSLIERFFADGVYVMIDYATTIIPASEEGE